MRRRKIISRQPRRAGQRDRTDQGQIAHPLLYQRRVAARLLSVSIDTLWRLEKAGRLTPVKLSGLPNGSTYYRHIALAQGHEAMGAGS